MGRGEVLTGFYWLKKDFARSEATRCPEQSRREANSQKQLECQINRLLKALRKAGRDCFTA